MAVQYLLPCECGSTTPIDTSQAGGSVVCSCGETLEVPSLRAIRDLTPLSETTEVRKYQWNPTAGLLFVSGLIIAITGGGVAFSMHRYSRLAVDFDLPREEDVAAWVAEVDTLPPEELIDMWNDVVQLGLGEYEMSPFVHARMLSQRFARYRNMALIVMGSGIAIAVTSMFLRRKPE